MLTRPTKRSALPWLLLLAACGGGGAENQMPAGVQVGAGSGSTSGGGGAQSGGGAGGTGGSASSGSGGRDEGQVGVGDGGTAGTQGVSVGDAGGEDGECSAADVPEMPANVDPAASPEEQAAALYLAVLDRHVGRYLRGELRVYRGTLEAHDNASTLSFDGSPRQDGSIAEGPALAVLEVREASGSYWSPSREGPQGDSAFLMMRSLADGMHLLLEQPESHEQLTEAGLITPGASSDRLTMSCTDCVPSLFDQPDSIAFTDLTMTGTVTVSRAQGPVDLPAKLVASAELAVAEPCSLTFEELRVLDADPDGLVGGIILASFEESGDEWVWHTSNAIHGPGAPCSTIVRYTIELYIDRHDLSHYGVRNVQLEAPAQMCQAGAGG